MTKIRHNIAVDYLRGLAVLFVIGIHFFDLYGKVNGIASEPLYHVFGHGYFGVTVFFVISGFLITHTSLERTASGAASIDTARFYARRATRILPLLIAVLLIGVVLLNVLTLRTVPYDYVLHTSSDVYSGWFWLSVATFQYNWFKVYAHLQGRYSALQWDIMWSLAVEEQFYLLFPWLVTALRSTARLRKAMYGVIAFGTLLRLILTLASLDTTLAGNVSFTCFEAIAIGVLVALAQPWPARRARIAVPVAFVVLAVCYVLGALPLGGLPVLGIALSTGVLIQASRSLALPAVFKGIAWLADLGRLSYGVYLLHPIVLLATASLATSGRLNPFAGFLIVLIAIYLTAKASFVFFERPVEQVTRRMLYDLIASTRARKAALVAKAARRPGRVEAETGAAN